MKKVIACGVELTDPQPNWQEKDREALLGYVVDVKSMLVPSVRSVLCFWRAEGTETEKASVAQL